MSHLSVGFELEGFRFDSTRSNIILPKTSDPVDGFPGLVELRNYGGGEVMKQLLSLVGSYLALEDSANVCFQTFEYKFPAVLLHELRRRTGITKEMLHVRNIYGLAPRNYPKHQASFQISLSNKKSFYYTDSNKESQTAEYNAVFDYVSVIRKLDEEFKYEIKTSKRRPGFYALKEGRVEYRSLPNFVGDIFSNTTQIRELEQRISRCLFED